MTKDVIATDRWNICRECEFLWKKKICKKCGCVMPLKIKFRKASCPIGKWSSVNE